MKRFSGIMICGYLLAGVANAHGGAFNVRDYGAVGDDKTDNTAAFSKCLDAIVAAGGGRMFLPNGVYRGRITIPPVSKPIPTLDIEIAGPGQTDANNEWQATETHIDDPGNLGAADINYWVVEGNVGVIEKFTINGGATIRARRIGSTSGKEIR